MKNDFQLGVMIDSFNAGFDESLDLVSSMDVPGIHFFTTYGEMAPDKLSAADRREVLKKVSGRGLVISALCGDLHQDFADPRKNGELLEHSKRIMDLACDLETGIVTTHVGAIPEDRASPRYRALQEICGRLGEYAQSVNVFLAIETGTEPAAILKDFLDSTGCKKLAVNLDPANLVMLAGDDPVQAVHTLGGYIVHTHAKDGRMVEGGYEELPLGQGNVDYPAYLAALEKIGFRGFLSVERESGMDRAGDIRRGLTFLKGLL
jgi:sugar phosphate isomerase/epimerase